GRPAPGSARGPHAGHRGGRGARALARRHPVGRGVVADWMGGGLKVDLSSLFELSDAAFRATEYGAGAGTATFVWNPWGPGYARRISPAFADAKTLVRFTEPGYPSDHRLAPIYSFTDAYNTSRTNPTPANAVVRGPLWEALRAHHLLYRELQWQAAGPPVLRARAHFPNVISLAGNINASTAHYGHLYNRMDTTEDMWASETLRGTPAPLPTKPGVTPYVARQQLVFGLVDAGGELRLVLSPVTVLHNPYNVALRRRPRIPRGSQSWAPSCRCG
ncbi:MAG: hypothetical protein ACKORI_05250, partial [Verrucomicrobiota bacterium]